MKFGHEWEQDRPAKPEVALIPPSALNMKREFSAGGIILNNQGQVLLICASNMKEPDKKHWGFPKGNVGEGEIIQEAALREVKEEAGVEAEIIEKVGDSKYVYTKPCSGEKVFKVVSIFLMKYLSGDPQNHDWEVAEAKWFRPEEALKTISFSQDKQLFKKALEMYGQH